jgi:hypothetical protein
VAITISTLELATILMCARWGEAGGLRTKVDHEVFLRLVIRANRPDARQIRVDATIKRLTHMEREARVSSLVLDKLDQIGG